jgi:hypothetical protein
MPARPARSTVLQRFSQLVEFVELLCDAFCLAPELIVLPRTDPQCPI